MTRRCRLSALLLLVALPLVGCSRQGEECDTCTSDDDCNGGLVCTTFSDGSHRCGSGVGSTTCRTMSQPRPGLAAGAS
jgi:hypothetical protein